MTYISASAASACFEGGSNIAGRSATISRAVLQLLLPDLERGRRIDGALLCAPLSRISDRMAA